MCEMSVRIPSCCGVAKLKNEGSSVPQLWKALEVQAQEALGQATQQLSGMEEAHNDAARLRWTADIAQRCLTIPMMPEMQCTLRDEFACGVHPQALTMVTLTCTKSNVAV